MQVHPNVSLLRRGGYQLYNCYNSAGNACGCLKPLKQDPKPVSTRDHYKHAVREMQAADRRVQRTQGADTRGRQLAEMSATRAQEKLLYAEALRARGEWLASPQCTAHGYCAQRGVTEVVDSLYALGYKGYVALEWPCHSMPCGKMQARASSGRFTKQPDARIDAVCLDDRNYVLSGLEINGPEHLGDKAKKNDNRKGSTAGFPVLQVDADVAQERALEVARQFWQGPNA